MNSQKHVFIGDVGRKTSKHTDWNGGWDQRCVKDACHNEDKILGENVRNIDLRSFTKFVSV